MTRLDERIIESGLIEEWGGVCVNKTDGDIPYGIGVSTGAQNIFSADDNYSSSGYMYIAGVSPTEFAYLTEIKINIFSRKLENEAPDYSLGIALHNFLRKRRYEAEIELNTDTECEFCHFITITIQLRTFTSC